MNEVGIVETDLDLCRMYVDVVIFAGHLNEQEDDGEPVGLQQPAIGFLDGV